MSSKDSDRFAEAELLVLHAYEARTQRRNPREERRLLDQAVLAVGVDVVKQLAEECVCEFPFLGNPALVA